MILLPWFRIVIFLSPAIAGPCILLARLNTRTVAIFQNPNFDHWGPPSSLARIVHQPGGCSVEEVFKICLEELSLDPTPARFLREESLSESSPSMFICTDKQSSLGGSRSRSLCKRLFFLSRCAQVLFLLSLMIYTWFFPPSGIFAEGTWTDAFTDTVGIGGLIARRLTANMGTEPWREMHSVTPSQNPKAHYHRRLTAYIRHPIYVGNLLIGLGMIFLSEAFSLTLLFLAFFALHHRHYHSRRRRAPQRKARRRSLTSIVSWFRNTFPWLCPGEGSHSAGIFLSVNLALHAGLS